MNELLASSTWQLTGAPIGQVDREGNVLKRYGSSTTPLQIEEDIKKLL